MWKHEVETERTHGFFEKRQIQRVTEIYYRYFVFSTLHFNHLIKYKQPIIESKCIDEVPYKILLLHILLINHKH